MRITARVPSERDEQIALFQWAKLYQRMMPELALLHHIPNGGSRNQIEAYNLKRQGVKPGVPDICLPIPNGQFSALYIELKRRKGGRLSDDQRGWIEALNRAGNRAVVCKGWEEARDEIITYLRKG